MKIADVQEAPNSPTAISKVYETHLGKMFHGRIEDALEDEVFLALKGKINLIVTSPPFPLVRKKKYGNETGEAYLESDSICVE